MTLYEYQQQAKKTACPQADLTYCVLGLVNEAGEVAGVVKKWRRGDYGEDVLREKLRGELGDVLWYVAMVADRDGESFEDWQWPELLYEGESRSIEELVLYLVLDAAECATVREGGYEEDDFVRLLSKVLRVAHRIGLTLPDIAAHNLAKLADRQQRGVIRGDGDER